MKFNHKSARFIKIKRINDNNNVCGNNLVLLLANKNSFTRSTANDNGNFFGRQMQKKRKRNDFRHNVLYVIGVKSCFGRLAATCHSHIRQERRKTNQQMFYFWWASVLFIVSSDVTTVPLLL